ncbi:chromatin-associated protein [Enterocytozoon bieneusi H348]|nr:chromatin-associated protein [Enterocytozoon bieneusi H348]|eukprot:XP_002651129.1 chromatin-associated protein [Enterocytozoon bieneusi H348]
MPKGNKKPKDKNAPKKPCSSYMLFGHELRKNDATIKALKVTEQAKQIGERWNALTEAEKSEYEKKAMEAKEKYNKELEIYKTTDEYKEYMKTLKEWEKSFSKKRSVVRPENRYEAFCPGYKEKMLTPKEWKELNRKLLKME